MASCVFLQFFTRYVLNDSYAWTEEIATYCLIGVVFLGSAMCVRLSRHIQVDLVYRYLPHARRRARCRPLIDLIRIAFFGYAIKLVWQLHPDHRRRADDDDQASERASSIYAVLLGFVADVRARRSRSRSRTGGAAIRSWSDPAHSTERKV